MPVDTIRPTLVALSPADGALGVGIASNIIFTFSENMQLGSGAIMIHQGSLMGPKIETFDVSNTSRIRVSGASIIIDPTSDLAPSTHYYLMFDNNVFSDLAGNTFVGALNYDFTTSNDVTPPKLQSIAPTEGAFNVPISTQLHFLFSEPIQPGEGFISIHTGSPAGPTVDVFDVTSAKRVSVSGSDLILDRSTKLEFGTHYYVTFDPGVIKDLSGNPLSDNTAGAFITEDPSSIIFGTNDNDTLSGSIGDNLVDGKGGLDTFQVSGYSKEYRVSKNTDSVSIADNITMRDGADILNNIEKIKFLDGSLVYDIPITDDNSLTYRLYQAAFARAPDEGGLRYWIDQHNYGKSFLDIGNSFIASTEFVNLYGTNPTNAQFVDLLYQNVLGRQGDQGGVDFWNRQLNSGSETRPQILLDFASSPENVANTQKNIINGYWFE